MSKSHKVSVTKDYSIFHACKENRPPNLKRHKKLQASMEKYGFLKSFPIVCTRDAKGRLIVKDGQHRLLIAQSLGIPVWWIEEEVEFDIAEINCASKGWVLRDYAERFKLQGNKHYIEGLEFAEDFGIPLGMAFALLGGTVCFTNVEPEFVAGEFKVKDRQWAYAVASMYEPLVEMVPSIKGRVFLLACMAVCRVEGFEVPRMIAGAKNDLGLLKPFAHRDEFIAALEELYNWKRALRNRVPLKFLAGQVMLDRRAAKPKAKPPAEAA